MLTPEAQRLTAGSQDREVWAGGKQGGNVRSCLEDLLEVIKQEQLLLRREEASEGIQQGLPSPLADAKCTRDRGNDKVRITDQCQVDEDDAVTKLTFEMCADLEGKAGLARTPGTGHGDEPHLALGQHRGEVRQFPLSPDQRG